MRSSSVHRRRGPLWWTVGSRGTRSCRHGPTTRQVQQPHRAGAAFLSLPVLDAGQLQLQHRHDVPRVRRVQQWIPARGHLLTVVPCGAVPGGLDGPVVGGAGPGAHEPRPVPLGPADGAAVRGLVRGEDQPRAGDRRDEPAARPERGQPGGRHGPYGHRGHDPVVLPGRGPVMSRTCMDGRSPSAARRSSASCTRCLSTSMLVTWESPSRAQARGGAVAGAGGDQHVAVVGDHRVPVHADDEAGQRR